MNGYKSSAYRWNCKTQGCQVAAQPDWGDLFECFPRGIMPTDIDGMVEINGHFLFLEEKGCGAASTTGQGLAFKRLATLHQNVAVVYFRPHPETGLEVMTWSQRRQTGWVQKTREQFKDQLKQWSRWADSQIGTE